MTVEIFHPFDRFALEDPSTNLSMMPFPCPPAPDGLPYVSEWATDSRDVTVRIQVGVRVRLVRFENSGISRKMLFKNIEINVYIVAQASLEMASALMVNQVDL